MILFTKYMKLKKYLTHLSNLRYFISGLGLNLEEHENNKHLLHFHIYVEYKEPTRIYISKVYGAHIMNKIDNSTGIIEYVKSQELGIFEQIGRPARSSNITIREAKLLSIEELQDLDIKYTNIVKNLITEKYNDVDIDEYYKGNKLKIFYIYGPSGSGKSKAAVEYIKAHGYKRMDVVKYRNGFYIGISGKNKVCLYDEFRPSDMPVNEFISFIDYNAQTLNIKGGNVRNLYELIIITSVISPYKMYAECTNSEETRTQWLRRMNIIKLNKDGKVEYILDEDEVR